MKTTPTLYLLDYTRVHRDPPTTLYVPTAQHLIARQVRAEVFHTLEGPQEGLLPPPLSNENLLINELVREYLSYNGYANALGVFLAESGQPSDRSLDRTFLRDEVRTAAT